MWLQALLKAVGLPELITTSLADYEALALKLARGPSLLAARSGMSIVREGVEEQVGVAVAREVVGERHFWRKYQSLLGNPTRFGLGNRVCQW